MGALERPHQEQLKREHEARLSYLELRQAREGFDTPAEVLTEIDQIRASIARLNDALNTPLPAATVQALSPDDRYQGHVAWQMRMESALYTFGKRMDSLLWAVLGIGAWLLILTTALVVQAL